MRCFFRVCVWVFIFAIPRDIFLLHAVEKLLLFAQPLLSHTSIEDLRDEMKR